MLLSWNKLLVLGFFQFLGWWCSDLIGWFAGLRVDVACAGASSLEPQPGHCVSSLGKDSLAPYILLPRSSNGHQRKAKGNPTIWMNVKSHGGREAFTLFHSFQSPQETGIQDGYGNARRQSFDSVRIKLAKTNWISLRLSLRDFSFWLGK